MGKSRMIENKRTEYLTMSEIAKYYTEGKLTDEEGALLLADCINSAGHLITTDKTGNQKPVSLDFTDAVTSEDFYRWLPHTIPVVFAQSLTPPPLVTQYLFRPITVGENVDEVQIWSVGSLEVYEYAEGKAPKESDIDFDSTGYLVKFRITKKGVMIGLTREALRRDSWGYLKFWLDEARKAFPRKQEDIAIKLLTDFGMTVMDNNASNVTDLGTTTGRSIAGAQNGAFTANDLYNIWAYASMRGRTIDTIIMHPFAWKAFLADREMREVVLDENRVGNTMPQGAVNPGWGTIPEYYGVKYYGTGTGPGTADPTINVLGKIGINPYVNTLNPMLNTFTINPVGFPGAVRVIPSFRVRFKKNAGLARPVSDIIFCDSSATGVIANRSPLQMEQWDTISTELHHIKLREEWGMGLIEQGRGVFLAKNIVIDKNYDFQNVNYVTLSALHTNTTVPSGATY